jgi:periplasmic protein TonB
MSPIRSLGCLLLLALPLGGCRREPEPVVEPRRLSESPFQYPDELWDAGVQGRTTLRVFITERGTVDSVRVGETSGHQAFDSAALAGARKLKFEPARRGDRPIAVWRSLPVEFNLGPAGDSAARPTQSQPSP